MKRYFLLFLIISLGFILNAQELNLVIEKQDVLCYGESTGSATAVVAGGTEPYEYIWSNSSEEYIIENLNAGTYSVTVEDAIGTTVSGEVVIEEPSQIYVTAPWGGTICIGESFSTYVNATGGTLSAGTDYNYIWTGSDDSVYYGNLINVSPDDTTTYQVIVQDANGCVSEPQEIIVNVMPPISIDTISCIPAEICQGETVIISMEFHGGNGGPYTITFVDYQIVNIPYIFYPNESGWFSFSVSDLCGSQDATDSVYITVNPSPEQFLYSQIPSNGILPQGEYGQIILASSETGVVYYITSNYQLISEEIEGTGASIDFGNNFTVGTYKIMSRKLSCGCVLLQGTVVFSNENGISTNSGDKIKIYPNPVKDIILLEGVPQNSYYTIYDIKGDIIEKGMIEENTILLNKYTTGTYVLVLENKSQEILRQKFIVE